MFEGNKMTLAQKLRLREYLKFKCDYNEKETFQAISAVDKMSSDMREKLMEFIVTGKISSCVIENVTVTDLMEKAGMNPVTAFLAMDYLSTEPDEAKYILTRKTEKMEIDVELVEKLKTKVSADK